MSVITRWTARHFGLESEEMPAFAEAVAFLAFLVAFLWLFAEIGPG